MSATLAKKYTMGIASVAAAAGMMFAVAAPASAVPVTTDFDNACHANAGLIKENVSEPFSVATNDLGSGNWTVQMGQQTTPSGAFGYTFIGLKGIQLRMTVAPGATVTLGPDMGYGYTGTPVLDISGTQVTIKAASGSSLDVTGPNVDYKLPMISVSRPGGTSHGVSFTTAGNAGKYGNFAENYFTFQSIAKPFIGGPVTANTSCIPANGVLPTSAVGTSPTLNGGAANPLP
ncbi:MAG: hypothetical protein U5O16_13790 [Rhodococcus sp. (in: high G+C Gram-positive bacteria)]|uniref:hypothetical protein n=1 Tax=Rhodococcus sp. TaxID=1831 RepID=UPI002AD76961|nr:hypothetical protein [Rhodococcus sp. (in: high G+C Gram-positive bacteria)]